MYRTTINGMQVEVDTVEELKALLAVDISVPVDNVIDATKYAAEHPENLLALPEEDNESEPAVLELVKPLQDKGTGGVVAVRQRLLDVVHVLRVFQKEGLTARGIAEVMGDGSTYKAVSQRLQRLQDCGLAYRVGWTWFPTERAVNATKFIAS